MPLWLLIASYLVGISGAVSAFWGKNTREGKEALPKRITKTGWVTILSLLTALTVTFAKDIHSHSDDIEKARAADRAKADANERQSQLLVELVRAQAGEARANTKLEAAIGKLEDLKALNQEFKNELTSTDRTVIDMRKTLGVTRDDLTRESVASLVSAMANTNAIIRTILVIIPFTSKVPAGTTESEVLFPRFSQQSCRDLIGIETKFTGSSDDSHLVVYPNDLEKEHHSFDKDPPEADGAALMTSSEDKKLMEALLELVDQKSTNYAFFTFGYYTLGEDMSAAELYTFLTKPGMDILQVESTWPRKFKTLEDLKATGKKYPNILPSSEIDATVKKHEDESDPADIPIEGKASLDIPLECSTQLKDFFAKAFDRAVLEIQINQEQGETISYKLKAGAPVHTKEGWAVHFSLVPPPRIAAFSKSDITEGLFDALPSEKKKGAK